MFFFNDTATTEIYTLSLHDALPIYYYYYNTATTTTTSTTTTTTTTTITTTTTTTTTITITTTTTILLLLLLLLDRKSTRLNSSHANISYAVFCLKKKKTFTLSS